MEISRHGSCTSSSTPSTPTTHINSPIPITRSDPNSPYPTTFVTADTSSFKQVVQMLTGSDPNNKQPPQNDAVHLPPPTPCSRNFVIPPIKPASNKKQQLYERRNSLKNSLLMINPLPRYQNASFSPRKAPEILSPSVLDFPSLTLSPVTPLSSAGDEFDKSSHSSSEEERAIAEKGFYLHPSPLSTPRDGGAEPQLLPLFPLSSPRVSDPSSY